MSNLLNWPHWVIDLVEENDHDYRISAHLLNPPTSCTLCGTVGDLRPYGVREQRFMDLPIHAKRVGILVGRWRFKCHSCGRIAIEPLADMDEEHRITKRLLRFVQSESLRITFAEVARQCGLDEKTVRDIFKAHTAQLAKTYQVLTPAVLGIDELHLLNKPRCVFTNVETHTIIDLLEKRDQKTVQKYLAGLTDGHRVEVVTMDMWNPYRLAVEAALPNAIIVIDKFHIQRMANQALDKVRKALRESLSEKKRRQLKRDRFILLHRKRDLDDQDLFILDTWTKNFPELGQAYELKEFFFDIWDETDKAAAWARYLEWKKAIPAELADKFKDITTAIGNWQAQIFNYFDTGVTNAYTEALNGIIKIANRNGRGYSFDAIRSKVLYAKGSHMGGKPIYRKSWEKTSLPEVPKLPSGAEPLAYLYEFVPYDPDDETNVNFGVAVATFAKLLMDYPNEPDSTTKSG
jgi:transposase